MSLNVSNLFIVTWDAVGYYPSGTDRVRLNNMIKITESKQYLVLLMYTWLRMSTCMYYGTYCYSIFVTGFWKTDHIVMREINRISMFMLA